MQVLRFSVQRTLDLLVPGPVPLQAARKVQLGSRDLGQQIVPAKPGQLDEDIIRIRIVHDFRLS